MTLRYQPATILRRLGVRIVPARHAPIVAALLVLLAVSVGEPILCIAHCQLLLPAAAGQPAAHAAHRHGGAVAVATYSSAPAAVSAGAQTSASDGCPLHSAGESDRSIPPPPSPIHDLVIAAVSFLAVLLLRGRCPAPERMSAPRTTDPPPLPPPRLLCAR